jgi:hypothetical protein
MAATTQTRVDLSSSTGIEHHLRRFRVEPANQVALLWLERTAAAAAADCSTRPPPTRGEIDTEDGGS